MTYVRFWPIRSIRPEQIGKLACAADLLFKLVDEQ